MKEGLQEALRLLDIDEVGITREHQRRLVSGLPESAAHYGSMLAALGNTRRRIEEAIKKLPDTPDLRSEDNL